MSKNEIAIVPVVVLLLSCSSLDIFAQEETAAIASDDRVRVTSPTIPDGLSIGKLISIHADSLAIKTESREFSLTIPLDQVKKLEISLGQKTNMGRGVEIGFWVGAGIGAIISAAAYEEADNPLRRHEAIFVGGAVFGVMSALIGAGTGAVVKSEKWREVDLEGIR